MIFLYINKLMPKSVIIFYCDYARMYRVIDKNILICYKAMKT